MRKYSKIIHAVTPAVVAFVLSGCTDSDKTGRQPLGAATADGSAAASENGAPLPLAAMTALEAGNTAYRAKNFDQALVKYREAAAAAPGHAAPWFGISMVANELKNRALADSATSMVKALSADPTAIDAHSTARAPSPVPGALPPGHPATQALPPGHPTPTKPRTPAAPTRKGAA